MGKATLSDILRRTIIRSEIPLLVLERETAVQRASVRRFLDGKQSIRLDVADKLAAYFNLTLVTKRKAK